MSLTILLTITKYYGWAVSLVAFFTALIVFGEKIKPIIKKPFVFLRKIINKPAMVMANQILDVLGEIRTDIRNIDLKVEAHGHLQKIIWDTDGTMYFRADKAGETFYVSPEAIRFLQLDISDVAGSNWMNRIPQPYRDKISENFRDCARTGRTVDHDYPFKIGSGELVWFNTYAEFNKTIEEWAGVHRVIREPSKTAKMAN